ncbi:hypothetical protein C8J57DRAFT_1470287 [Mycena rebaudengoi]|nr:hypothetical protein C8J57DRAFT_1470287 [Mycena rebaudengoi]
MRSIHFWMHHKISGVVSVLVSLALFGFAFSATAVRGNLILESGFHSGAGKGKNTASALLLVWVDQSGHEIRGNGHTYVYLMRKDRLVRRWTRKKGMGGRRARATGGICTLAVRANGGVGREQGKRRAPALLRSRASFESPGPLERGTSLAHAVRALPIRGATSGLSAVAKVKRGSEGRSGCAKLTANTTVLVEALGTRAVGVAWAGDADSCGARRLREAGSRRGWATRKRTQGDCRTAALGTIVADARRCLSTRMWEHGSRITTMRTQGDVEQRGMGAAEDGGGTRGGNEGDEGGCAGHWWCGSCLRRAGGASEDVTARLDVTCAMGNGRGWYCVGDVRKESQLNAPTLSRIHQELGEKRRVQDGDRRVLEPRR